MSGQNSIDPVLIVGAGPTGLTAALTLVKNGIPVRIISKDHEYHREQRGISIQPRTLEVFHFLGVLPDLLARGRTVQGVRYYKMPGAELASTTQFSVTARDADTPQKPFNNSFQLPQHHTEAVLREHLARYGCVVEMSTELLAFEQHSDRVEVILNKQDSGKKTVETKSYRWIIGADGGKSTVRKHCGLSFEGSSTQEKWVIGEIQLEGLEAEFTYLFTWPGKVPVTSILLRATDEGRYFFMCTGDIDPDKVVASADDLKATLRFLTGRGDLRLGDIAYVTDYRPSVRMVNKYGEGRVFVAGDAAHVHTPRGGQGLNSGVQDAINISWKLALVEKGLAPRSLLDTYTEERIPVIKHMLQETVDVGKRFAEGARDAKTFKPALQSADHLKQFGVNYRWSSIVLDERSPRSPEDVLDPYGLKSGDVLRAGDRAPDATGLVHIDSDSAGTRSKTSLFNIFSPARHNVLVFGEDISFTMATIRAVACYPRGVVASVVVLSQGAAAVFVDGADVTIQDCNNVAYDGYKVSKGQNLAVIVRPDGFIGAVALREKGVVQYLEIIFAATTRV